VFFVFFVAKFCKITRRRDSSMNFILIALCILAGLVFRSSGILRENAHKGINTWVLYIAMPAVALMYIPAIQWSSSLILPLTMPIIVWGGAWLMVNLFSGRMNFDRETRAALLLTAGLGNTSFVGFPLTQAYFGDEGLRIAIICDQISFVILSTLGMITALKSSQSADRGSMEIIGNLFRFPPFLAFIAALVLPHFVDLAWFDPLLTKLAGTLVPLALFSVGSQIRFAEWKHELVPLSLGLGYKLLIAPALVLCAALLLPIRGVIAQASVFEAAMAPMVTSAILASEYQLNPRISNLMVSVGIVLSILTTALWWFVLRALLS
jgi:malate permease and related proteins